MLGGRFRIHLGRPLQETSSARELDLPVVDLRDDPLPEREKKPRQLVSQEARKPVNLAKGPLMRARLFCLGENEHILLLVFHHITFDASVRAGAAQRIVGSIQCFFERSALAAARAGYPVCRLCCLAAGADE